MPRPASGLAAIQIGEPKRVVTMDLAKKDDEKEPQVFINPEILWTSDEKNVHEEGCLSIPEYYEEVERPAEVKVKYHDLDGKAHEVHADRLARDLPAARDRSSQRRAVHRSSSPSSSATASSRNIPSRPSARRRADMPLRLIFMGTPDFAVPTLVELAGAGHEIAAVYTRAPKPKGRGMDLQDTPVAREAKRFGIPVLTPSTLRTPQAQAEFRRSWRRCRGGRGLRIDPAEGGARCRAAWLFQPACVFVAALARRRADQPRDDGGRCRHRRDGDENGRGARYRPDRHGGARCHWRRHDGGRIARQAQFARCAT